MPKVRPSVATCSIARCSPIKVYLARPHASSVSHVASSDLLQAVLSHFTHPGLNIGLLLEQGLEVLAMHFGQFRIDHYSHGGIPWSTEKEREFAKEIAHPEARPRGHFDFQLALQHQKEGLASRARFDHG